MNLHDDVKKSLIKMQTDSWEQGFNAAMDVTIKSVVHTLQQVGDANIKLSEVVDLLESIKEKSANDRVLINDSKGIGNG